MEYDFSILHDRDFESLACDLIGRHLGVRIERFRPGRDAGVDGRWFCAGQKEVVLQCKNWSRTGTDKLLVHLISQELPKVRKIAPSRYIVATSVPLSRANKRRIAEGMKPYVRSDDDIYGRDDLQDLLVRAPEVEARHPKLWLATSNVIARILNSDLTGRTGFAIEEIKKFSRYYVETEDAIRARRMLDATHVLIVKGEPGVGKTTLAHQLLLESVSRGYAPYLLNCIEDGERAFDKESKQFFLFDDFLGGNLLEVIKGNEDAKIVAFIRRVVAAQSKLFVLTSRTHILEQGKDASELFRLQKISAREFELTVGGISRLEKAKILYSHIWAGGLPSEVLDSIYESKRYLKVIDHRNFNPRLVAFITDPDRVRGLSKDEYWAHVSESFRRPAAIWDHVFRKQVSADVRDIAFLVAFNGSPIAEEDLRAAFRRFTNCGDPPARFAQRFYDAVKLSIGSVANRSLDKDGIAAISLFNPSVADYLLSEAPRLGLLEPLFAALETTSSLEFLETLTRRKVVSSVRASDLLVSIANSPSFGANASEYEIAVASRVIAQGRAQHIWPKLEALTLRVPVVSRQVMPFWLDILHVVFEKTRSESLALVVDDILEVSSDLMDNSSAMAKLCAVAKLADQLDGGSRLAVVSEQVVGAWVDNAHHFVVQDAVLDMYLDEDQTSLAFEEVWSYIESELRAIGAEFSEDEVSDIAGEVDVYQIIRDNRDSAMGDYSDDLPRGELGASDAEISDYFER